MFRLLENKRILTKTLAIVGNILIWGPILFLIFISIGGTIADQTLRFDYLMLAELFPFILIGNILLLWTAIRIHWKIKIMTWELLLLIIFLFSSQIIAIISGLASGRTEPAGWAWVIVLICIALYNLSVIIIGISGIVLMRKIFSN